MSNSTSLNQIRHFKCAIDIRILAKYFDFDWVTNYSNVQIHFAHLTSKKFSGIAQESDSTFQFSHSTLFSQKSNSVRKRGPLKPFERPSFVRATFHFGNSTFYFGAKKKVEFELPNSRTKVDCDFS